MTPLLIDLGETEARVSEKGGTITRLTHKGKPIFATQFEKSGGKMRGGCHACAPWFGSSDLGRQHGHLRDIAGRGISHHNAAYVELARGSDSAYPWNMAYNTKTIIHESGIIETGFSMRRLNDEEKGGDKAPAPANPAQHPYYACTDASKTCVIVNGKREYGFSDKAHGIEMALKREIIIEMPDRWMEISLGGAFMERRNPWIFLWTDAPKEYVCVEPVLYDPTDFNTPKGLSLKIGQVLDISMTLKIYLR
ncbi:hypothetical protein M1432_02485 [Patescibacteria group bacterium]|nr:hypothetical protein [Patescibacteria group bacterium]